MILSEISIKRPVFAAVLSLLLLAFGLIAFEQLPLREYPDIDPPIVSIQTVYPGAAANIVETRVTKIIEDRISGIEGIKYIESNSTDGESRINIEFNINRDIEAATNDIRDRVSGVIDNLPAEVDPPDIQKADSSDDVIVWLNLVSDRLSTLELTDYAKRYLQDKFSVLPGVARVRIGGGLEYAMRIWIDRHKLAAYGLSVIDIENALRRENVELPAGNLESKKTYFSARLDRLYHSEEDFRRLVIAKQAKRIVRLSDVATIKKSAIENRTFFHGNGIPMIGLGIIKQSTANTIDVARAAVKLGDQINQTLPEGMEIINSYDTSVFVENAIHEVYKTLFIAIFSIVLVIYLFIGSVRATLIPAITVPVSLIATFMVLYFLGQSLNLLTLLALVLATGLVVDDSIVVIENISRRIDSGESRLVAALYGAQQVGFAVIATTLVLLSVFIPIAFMQGDLGRLFGEFAVTLSAAVIFSTFIALTLCVMLCSKVLTNNRQASGRAGFFNARWILKRYRSLLTFCLNHIKWVALMLLLIIAATGVLFTQIPSEYTPKEDRGALFLIVNGPEGANYDFMRNYMLKIEHRLMPYVDSGEVTRLLIRAPRGFGNISSFNNGIVIIVFNDWSQRRNGFTLMKEIMGKLADLPGVRVFPVMRQAFGRGISKPVQFVIGGGRFDELVTWRDTLLNAIQANNPGLLNIDSDYKETKPQLRVAINKERADDLGVSVADIGRTLETMLGSRQVTTYIDNGEEYDVILEGDRALQRTPTDMRNIYVRSSQSNRLIPLANLVTIDEFADSGTLNRYNRVRAITLEANLADDYSLGEALNYLSTLVRNTLPATATTDFKGESLDFKDSSGSLLFVFALGFVVVYLTLAALFESFVQPIIIILTVPFAVFGALLGLYITGNTLNIYTEIGIVMLIGLAAKNGILIVEYINQLREQKIALQNAVIKAAMVRFRPIVMTAITTMAGSIPLILSFGAGAETRQALGVVIFFGVAVSILFTLIVIPTTYGLIARHTKPRNHIAEQLAKESKNNAQLPSS